MSRMVASGFLAVLVSLATAAHAQSVVPEDAIFAVRVNLEAARATQLGKQLIDMGKKLATEELDDSRGRDKAFEDIEKALGFDPFETLQTITVFGSKLTDPIDGLRLVVEMQETTGNLEGLLLAVPGYQSKKHGDYTVHSVAPEDDLRIYGAIVGRDAKQILVAQKLTDLTSMLDALGGRSSTSPSDASWFASDSDAIVEIRLKELPQIEDLDDLEGPPANIVKLLRQVSLSIRERSGDFEVDLILSADTEEHAEQFRQLAQGLVAMVGLAQGQDELDEELEKVAQVVEGLTVSRQEEQVHLTLRIPEQLVIEFLREEADLPL